VKDARVEALKLSRSASEPSLSSDSDDHSNSWDVRRKISGDLLDDRRKNSPGPSSSILAEDACHVVYSSESVDSELSQEETPSMEGKLQSPASASSPAPEPLSVGSAKHDTNTCEPCIFMHMEKGCHNGSNCVFCHLVHKRKGKPRPCKSKRERLRHQVLLQVGLVQRGESSDQPPGAQQETSVNDSTEQNRAGYQQRRSQQGTQQETAVNASTEQGPRTLVEL